MAKSLDHNLDACRQRLVGTCMISYHRESRRYIASLITSLDYGENVDAPLKILENTRKAFQSLKDQISQLNANNATMGAESIGEVWAVRLNSGLFGVPWEETKAVLEEKDEEDQGKRLQNNIRIVYLPEEKNPGKLRKKGEEGATVTPDLHDPSPATAYAKSVALPPLRLSKAGFALDNLHKSARAERSVSSGRVKKAQRP